MGAMPKSKKPTRQPRPKPEVAVARRPRLLDQVVAKVRAAVETALDFADETAEKLTKSLRA